MLSRLMTLREQLLLLFVGVAILVGTMTYYLLNVGPEPPILIPLDSEDPPQLQAQSQSDASGPPTSPASIPAPVITPSPPPAVEQPAEPRVLTVAIEGAVRDPGIYEMEDGDRLHELLKEAGGAEEYADLNDINLTALLIDGTTLTVPSLGTITRGENSISVRRPARPAYNPPQYTRSGAGRMPESRTGSSSASTAAPGPAPSAYAGAESNGLINLNTASAEQLSTLPGIGPALSQRIIDYRTAQPFQSVDDLNNVSGIAEKRLEAVRPFVTVQ